MAAMETNLSLKRRFSNLEGESLEPDGKDPDVKKARTSGIASPVTSNSETVKTAQVSNSGSNQTEEYDVENSTPKLEGDELENVAPDILEKDTQDMNRDTPKQESSRSVAGDGEHLFPVSHKHDDGSDFGKIPEKGSVTRIASVQRDANVIATVVPNVNVEIVYKRLADKRANPNRMDIVTTELLDNPPVPNTKQNDRSDAISNDQGQTTTVQMSNMYEEVKAVVQKVKESSPNFHLNATEIYILLEGNRDRKDRTDFVAQLFLQSEENKEKATSRSPKPAKNIIEEVEQIVKEIPGSNPDKVYAMLEDLESETNRVEIIIEKLKEEKEKQENKSEVKKEDSFPDDPELRNDPVFRDMRIISKMFPDKDRNEIYAYIEAHHDKKDRVQVVIEEMLLKGSDGSQNALGSLSIDGEKSGETTVKFKGACRLQEEVDDLKEIFPDCDPNYLFEELEKRENERERVKNLAACMFEKRDYPKLKDVMAKQNKLAFKNRLVRLEFDLESFLTKFPNPAETFKDTEKKMNDNYKQHSSTQLKNDFPPLKDGYIKSVLEKNNHHFAPSLWEIESVVAKLAAEGRQSKKMRQQPRFVKVSLPDEPDEFFFHELLYTQNEKNITDHLKKKEKIRKEKVEEARAKGELYECGCCFDDECLFEDLSTCADGHLFCKECIRRSTETAVGQAKTKFPCLTGTCEHDIPLSILQQVVSPGLFSKLLMRLQEEEIRQADIPDLETCPYCSFATIMPDPNDKVFKCLNSDCLKESCRLCKELNHVPLKCSEVEKQGETDMRTYIENRISEAMLRTCHHCKKRFFKEFGCNKMTCTCGATMCYVCREPDIDYDHFNENGNCGHEQDVNLLHEKEMEKAASEAKEQYLRDHPDANDVELKYDPFKHVEEFRRRRDEGNLFGQGEDDDDDDIDGGFSDEDFGHGDHSDEDDYY